MLYTRRDIGRVALAAGVVSQLPAATKPDSRFKGVQIGAITYSFRSMPDQSAEATLKYLVDCGLSACELMSGPITSYMRKKGNWDGSAAAAAAAAVGGGGRGGGFPGGGGGRGPAPTYPVVANLKVGFGNDQPAGQWNGVACPVGRGGRAAAGASGAGAGFAGGPGGASGGRGGGGRGGGGGFGRGPQSPEQVAAADAERKWRLGLSMDIFKDLRRMYNDAGVNIYAIKDLPMNTDEDLDFMMQAATALGATHFTSELPAGDNAAATLKRLGETALKHKLFSAYHTHEQGSMTVFNDAFAISKGNKANVDLGHFMATANPAGTPLDFLNKFHDQIASYHLKDRTTAAHCGLNLPWGTGETPIAEILQTVSKNKWSMPGSVELEYDIPEGSDAVKEVAKCVEFAGRLSLSAGGKRPLNGTEVPCPKFVRHVGPDLFI